MAHWLLKSEPSSYSWDQLVADGRTNGTAFRNAQALNNFAGHEARGPRVLLSFERGEGDCRRRRGDQDLLPWTPPIRAASSAWSTSSR